ncbi:MAG: 6-phospho-alpha-glucosidase, partial [Clostridiaceae bacterium]
MRESNKITIVGAGSARTPALVGSMIKLKDRFPLKKVIFYDIDDERTSKMESYIRLVLKTYMSDTEVIFTTDSDEAYEDTDFVLCQMRVGKNEMRSYDEKIPLIHGLVGQETCGPGGFSYGMRSLGAMIEMVNQVRKHSKDTWIL